MEIKRMNTDFGNSIFMAMIDGHYFEMPTNVVEKTKEKAEGYFVSKVEKEEDFYNSMMISFEIDGEEKYFLVGEAAEQEVLGNQHIKQLHNKTESHIPYATFLASVAYYYGTKKHDVTSDDNITINYFQTMLPIWLLKKTDKFSEMQQKMAERFLGNHTVNILTPGLEKTLTIDVKQSKCRIEGEVARWAIKKDFQLEDNPEAERFMNNDTVVVDIGGGTVDLALLPAGLLAPKSRESLTSVLDIPYLAHLEKLRNEKMPEHFDEVRALEKFIVKNIGKSRMERKDGNSGKSVDLKEIIEKSLHEYAEILTKKVETAFKAPKDKEYKYLYIGGVSEILEDAVKSVIEKQYGLEIFENNHVFLPNARKLNLFGLEVLSIHETQKEVAEQTV